MSTVPEAASFSFTCLMSDSKARLSARSVSSPKVDKISSGAKSAACDRGKRFVSALTHVGAYSENAFFQLPNQSRTRCRFSLRAFSIQRSRMLKSNCPSLGSICSHATGISTVLRCRRAIAGKIASACAAVPAEELPSSPPKRTIGLPFTTSWSAALSSSTSGTVAGDAALCRAPATAGSSAQQAAMASPLSIAIRLLLGRRMPDFFIGPLQEPLHVRRVGVPAIVLAPGKVPIEQTLIHRRHLRGAVVAFHIQALGAEQGENAARVHGGHPAALMVEPVRIALFGNAVADEREPRSTERDKLV